MIDAVGRVSLAQEAVANVGERGELGLEQLQRRGQTVVTASAVHTRHAALSEQLEQRPAAAGELLSPRVSGDGECRVGANAGGVGGAKIRSRFGYARLRQPRRDWNVVGLADDAG